MLCEVSIRFPNLGITINDLKTSINIFGLDIAFYGIIIGIGILAGMLIAFREAKITGQKIDDYIDLALYSVIFAIIGARIYYVIFQWDYYKDNLPDIFNLRNGGLAIYGGIIGGILTALVISKIKNMNFLKVLDTACLGLILGQIIGRWGNFINREAYGGNSNGLLAMQINTNDGIVNITPQSGVSYIEGTRFIQVQPTFLYESLWNLILLIIIMIFRKKKQYDGEVFLWYIGGYALGRSIIEGMRTDQLMLPMINLPVSQVLSVSIVIAVVTILVIKRVRIKKQL